jgi:transaldolase
MIMVRSASLPQHDPEGLRRRLREELAHARAQARHDLLPWILSGAVEPALDHAIFFSEPGAFDDSLPTLLPRVQHAFATATPDGQRHLLRFCAELSLRLRSLLPAWNLSNASMHPSSALGPDEVVRAAGETLSLATALAKDSPACADALLEVYRSETGARFRAEGAQDPDGEGRESVGRSIADYLEATSHSVAASNLGCIARMRQAGATRTEISNDYAAFLPYAMLLGASFVTCNPPLVDLAWKAEPAKWDPVVDGLVAAHRKAEGDALARLVTLEIVLANMRRLRPIFLLTEGRMGCVSLQVNPKRHDDAETMLRDAAAIYAELERRLDGGVPNVVFKLPATYAGLQACRGLTAAGIGVTITVTFGLFQHLRFAEAISSGRALYSTLAHMTGRLAYPVRDELLARLGELGASGITEQDVRVAAAWSGVAVFKRLHRCLTARGTDLARVKPLIASLRVYTEPAYAPLPGPIPDITEIIGTGILTVFPNVRRAFDRLPAPPLDGRQIEAPVPAEIFGVLRHSEIFKQAYALGPLADPAERDLPELQPAKPLSLESQAATAAWTPVANTLSEFCKAYDSFVDRIQARRFGAG